MASHILQLYHTRKTAKNQYFFCEFFATSFRLPQKVFTPATPLWFIFLIFRPLAGGRPQKAVPGKAFRRGLCAKGALSPQGCVKKPTAGVRLAVGFL